MSSDVPAKKGFRICFHNNLAVRKGIACASLNDLKSKIKIKFGDDHEKFKVFTEDATEVDDDEFLMDLPNNTLLIVSNEMKPLQTASKPFNPAENLFDKILTLMRWSGDTQTVYQQVLELMNQDFQEKWSSMKVNIVDKEKGK